MLKEIRNQSRTVREIMFALSVIIVVSLVGAFWFRSFERDLFVMLNQSEDDTQRFFAERQRETINTESMFANLSKMGNNVMEAVASLGSILSKDDSNIDREKIQDNFSGNPLALPISEDK